MGIAGASLRSLAGSFRALALEFERKMMTSFFRNLSLFYQPTDNHIANTEYGRRSIDRKKHHPRFYLHSLAGLWLRYLSGLT
jgi:hypothetical protein